MDNHRKSLHICDKDITTRKNNYANINYLDVFYNIKLFKIFSSKTFKRV